MYSYLWHNGRDLNVLGWIAFSVRVQFSISFSILFSRLLLVLLANGEGDQDSMVIFAEFQPELASKIFSFTYRCNLLVFY